MSSGKRKLEEDEEAPRNETGKALFVRDMKGELVTVLPGQLMPTKVSAATEEAAVVVAAAAEQQEASRLAARSAEDIQYEAYLGGRDAKGGNVWIADAGKASTDKAAFADSISAQIAAEREASGGGDRQYATARAYDRGRGVKKQSGASSSGGGAFGGATSLAEAKAGASVAQAALERAREASDDEDDEASLSLTAAQLAGRAMAAYNLPVSNMAQKDPHGNDLRVPQLERKLRKFLECFAEEAAIRTLEGQPVLKDFDAMRKRYATVFRESGSELRGVVQKRPGLPLDGSLGLTPPREQDLIVLYHAEGGEIAGIWIAPDKAGLGKDPGASREAIEATDVFKGFRRQVEKLSGGAKLSARFETAGS